VDGLEGFPLPVPKKYGLNLMVAWSRIIIARGGHDLDGEEGEGDDRLSKTLTRHIRNQTDLRHRQIRNPNIEIRNKFEIQKYKTPNKGKTFGFVTFEFVSNFGFRASNLESALSIGIFIAILRTT
jgi:hypothetical protein